MTPGYKQLSDEMMDNIDKVGIKIPVAKTVLVAILNPVVINYIHNF